MVNSAAYTGPVGICRVATIVLGIISAVVITIGRASAPSRFSIDFLGYASTQSLQITAFLVAILSVIWLILLLYGVIPHEIACLVIDMIFHFLFLVILGIISSTSISFKVRCGEIPDTDRADRYRYNYDGKEYQQYPDDLCTFTICVLVACLLELCNAIVYGAVAVLDLMKLLKNQNTNSNQM